MIDARGPNQLDKWDLGDVWKNQPGPIYEAKTNHSIGAAEISAMQPTFLAGFHTALLVSAGTAAAGIFAALSRGPETEPLVRAFSTTPNTK
jgi:hypothetical protein